MKMKWKIWILSIILLSVMTGVPMQVCAAKGLQEAGTGAGREATEDGIELMQAAMVTRQRLTKVRRGPGVEQEVLGVLQEGQAVNVCGKTENGWYQIVYGMELGYVRQDLLVAIPVDEAMLAALAQQAAYVKQLAVKGIVPAPSESEEAIKGQSQEQLPQEQLPQEQLPQQQEAIPGSGNIIFVGDSRTGQMGNAVGSTLSHPGTAFVACFGGGYEWLSTVAAKQEIDQYVIPGSIIVINYGVNDLSRHGDYIEVINRYNRDWREKGAVVYFASVGPVGENEYGKRNWAVEYFNNQLNGRLDGSIGRIDLYGYLVATGYTTQPDGLHYTPDVYARMFTFLMQSIGKA